MTIKPQFTKEDMEKAYSYGLNNATETEFRVMVYEILNEKED